MSSKVGGWAGQILHVDLSSGKTWTEPSVEYGRKYIGGRGIAARIGWDEIPPGTGAFDPENRLILTVGPLTGTSAPNSGRATLCTLSPQAYPYEWFTYSSVGGFWAPTLKYAGYDAIVVQGDAATIAGRVREHLDAGADHVCVQVRRVDPTDLAVPDFTAVRDALGETMGAG